MTVKFWYNNCLMTFYTHRETNWIRNQSNSPGKSDMRSCSRHGFTLVEIMIVVAIIGILAAIAIPNFVKNRTESQRRACIANMRLIATSAENWRTENGMAMIGDDWKTKLIGPENYITREPSCPLGGVYTVLVADESGQEVVAVTCSLEQSKGHKLPPEE